jgi:hypothetical protein
MRLLIASLLLAAALGTAPGQDDAPAKFEAAFKADPVEALKQIALVPGDAARALARPALSRQIAADAAAGLAASSEGKADVAEKHLARAALLADPYAPDFSRQLLRTLALLKQPRKLPPSCGACKGAGGSACVKCKAGMVEGPCGSCEAKGSVTCLLCDGRGTLDHHGYGGRIQIVISRPTPFTMKNDKGKTVSGKLTPQTLTYTMGRCSGGSFSLRTESTGGKTDSVSQPCPTFWGQMKMFVFNGKLKLRVTNPKGELAPIGSAAARRLMAEYETCKGGSVPCDRCSGKKTDPCPSCAGAAKAPALCADCEGTALSPCGACKGYGDSSWLARLLPAAQAPALSQALASQAVEIKAWLDGRARAASRKEELARRLAEARKGADPTAKFDGDSVEIACPQCKGRGGSCEDCWGEGRREFTVGTSAFERYAIIDRLSKTSVAVAPPAPPALGALPEAEAALAAQAPARPETPKPATPLVVPAVSVPIPKTVEEMIRKADELFETGKVHLEKSKASSDNAVWVDEGLKAVADLRNAQTLYAAAQEKLDETGAPVPRELQQKYRVNMQALVMARKQIP